MNIANKYVPDGVPNNLKWYEKDGFLTWYDQIKWERFLEDLDRRFNNTKIVNFDIINKCVRGEELSEQTFTNYQTVQNKEMFEYPIKDREKIIFAALSSCVKRNVFVSKELVNEHLTFPLNGNTIFFSSMKKRRFNKKGKFLFQKKIF